MKISRREMMHRSVAAGVGVFGFPSILAAGRRTPVTLRVLGTHVTLQKSIQVAAKRELNINLEFIPGGSATVLQRASTRPESFDVYEQWSNSINVLWRARAIQPLDVSRIDRWNDVNPLSKTGRLTDDAPIGRGDAPHTLLYVQADGSLGSTPTNETSYLPYVHNADSFGYNTSVIPEGRAYEDESWGWLLDRRYRGKVAIVNEPTIGIFDLALAAQANGLMTFEDIGNMTVREVDTLFDILVSMKRDGHFAGVWTSVPQSVEFMKSGRTVIESMFSPAAADLRAERIPVRYAAPREGFRAWHGVMCLSSAAGEEVAEAAYTYMNWWLSGRAGAIMARQGYYISVPEAARQYMSDDEWQYWYRGKQAKSAILNSDGRTIAQPGDQRNGGDYETRFSRVAVWNTVMNEYEHTLMRWGEFLSSAPAQRGRRR